MKTMSFNDGLTMSDENKLMSEYDNLNNVSEALIKGKIIIRDDDGNIIMERDNLVVQNGREFVLNKLFNTGKYKYKTVNLFGVGSGGTYGDNYIQGGYEVQPDGTIVSLEDPDEEVDIFTKPFNPKSPNPNDKDLYRPEPFKVFNEDFHPEEDLRQNLSYYNSDEEWQVEVKGKGYYGEKPIDKAHRPVDQSDTRGVFYKEISNVKPEEIGDEIAEVVEFTNKVFVKLNMIIDRRDLRNKVINELGLYYSHEESYDTEFVESEQVELFSRVTFASEALKNKTKQLYIEYYVYA